MSSRHSAMTVPGMVLSQPLMAMTASNMWASTTSSMLSAMSSRLASDARIPAVPIVIPSEMAIVLSSIGVPPAAAIPCLTFAARARRWKLHGIVSIQVLATAMSGLARAASS